MCNYGNGCTDVRIAVKERNAGFRGMLYSLTRCARHDVTYISTERGVVVSEREEEQK